MIYGCLQPRELWFIDFNHVLAGALQVTSATAQPLDTMYMYVSPLKLYIAA